MDCGNVGLTMNGGLASSGKPTSERAVEEALALPETVDVSSSDGGFVDCGRKVPSLWQKLTGLEFYSD